jgi:hypothetical protein
MRRGHGLRMAICYPTARPPLGADRSHGCQVRELRLGDRRTSNRNLRAPICSLMIPNTGSVSRLWFL